ncbi:desulfoferrodoxin [Candidatus Bathyarchaeota archaeon]|nr:desulfoferrodoxin [Candidatus Bathyarchaeota archaeon]
MTNLLGKRYRCKVCGTEVLCTKSGDGEVMCCAEKMEQVTPRPIPSSD